MGNDGTHFIAAHNDEVHSNKGWVAVQLHNGVFALKASIFLERGKLKKKDYLSLQPAVDPAVPNCGVRVAGATYMSVWPRGGDRGAAVPAMLRPCRNGMLFDRPLMQRRASRHKNRLILDKTSLN